jgi:hypothetical protein
MSRTHDRQVVRLPALSIALDSRLDLPLACGSVPADGHLYGEVP